MDNQEGKPKKNKAGKNQRILRQVISADMHMLKDTYQNLDYDAFDQAVNTIGKAKKIYIVAVRSNAPIAEFLAFYLNLIVPDVHLVCSSSASELYEQMLHVCEKDVVIGISFPRYSMRTLKALEFANSRKAKVITLTDSVHSPMNLYSSCNLVAYSQLSTIVDSMTAAMSMINGLIVALCMKKKKQVLNNLEELERVWDEYPVDNHDEINHLDPQIAMEKVPEPEQGEADE